MDSIYAGFLFFTSSNTMKIWVLKAIVQKTISYLPFSNSINYLFQKYVTKGVYLTDEYFGDKIGHAKDHIDSYRKYCGKDFPESSLEIGTGWYPVVPISLFLCGTDKIYSVDISALTNKERILTTVQKFKLYHDSGKLASFVPFKKERYEVLEQILKSADSLTLDQITAMLNLTYMVKDARKLPFENESIDLVNSNNTFEHIYPEILTPILKEFKRIVKREGLQSHAIDMSDHFAHFDKSINIYNFLRFSDSRWSMIDNSIQPQSRLRFYDYVKIYSDLDIAITEQSYRKGDLEALKTIPLDPKYKTHTPEEVAISHCYLVSKM